ncbi:MAG TPA: hypothetical protein PKD98_23990 [Anaerolineae bacterium]|nr:hypothetical protein [Anaerolineae bacterium]
MTKPTNEAHTLAQLAAEVAQLRQQIDQVNQRLDAIYGAITRLGETKSAPAKPAPAPFSADALVTPGNMFEALRQHALNAGMDIPAELVNRLHSNLPTEEPSNGAK